MAASAALLLHYRASLNFMLDDWAFVIGREDGKISDFLDPHNEHISVIPVAIYKLFLAVFGMGSPWPLQIHPDVEREPPIGGLRARAFEPGPPDNGGGQSSPCRQHRPDVR